MKKLFTIIVSVVIVFAFASCTNGVVEPENNTAVFTVCSSEDLFEIADVYVDYSKTDGTRMIETGNIGQKMDGSCFTFSYTGDADEIGMKVVVKLKGEHTIRDEYNLKITLKSLLKQKKDISDTVEKTIAIEDLLDNEQIRFFFYYNMSGDKPVLSEAEPVDWSEKHPPFVVDVKRYSGKYCVACSETGMEDGTVASEFLKRLTQKGGSYSSDVDVFIIEGKEISSLTDDQYSNIVKLAARDGKIVLLDVNKEQFKQFADKFIEKAKNTDKSTFSEDFKIFFDRFCTVGGEYVNFNSFDNKIGIVALCNSNLFIVDDDEPTSGDGEYINTAGTSLNYLILWLKEDYKENIKEAYERAKVASNDLDLDSLESAQIIDTSFSGRAWNHWRGVSVPVHTRYYIWTAHSLDTGHDFYIIEQEVQAENNKWNCGVQDKTIWDKSIATPSGQTGDNWGSYGPYMAYLTMENTIDNKGDNVIVSEYSPTTQSGSTSVSTGVNFSLGGNIGINKMGVMGGLTGSVGFNRSETVSIPELRVEVAQDGPNLKFKYLGTDLGTHDRAFHWRTHDLAQGERINAMEVKNRWIWDINNKNTDKTYKFTGRIAITSHCMEYHNKSSGLAYEVSTYQQTIALPSDYTLFAPSRFCENYLLQAETPDDWDYAKKQAFQDFMVDKFENWYSNKNMYSPKENNLDDLAIAYFDDAMKTFEENKNVIATAGYTGTFNFYIQKTDGGIILKSQELVVE